MKRFFLVMLLGLWWASADAAPIQNLTMESYTAGANLPDPDPWCASSCGYGSVSTGTAQLTANCVPGNASSLLGTKCARWIIPANTPEAGVQVQCTGMCNIPVSEGDTLYMGFMWHFATATDMYADGPGANSADKGIGLHSPGQTTGGYRWDFSMGCWDGFTECTDHHHTVWVGNPNYHFNIGGCGENNDIYRPNVSPYTSGTVPQLAYNRWHTGVLAVTLSSGSSGRVQAWVDGEKFLDCPSIKTMDTSDNDYAYIEHQGTLCQPEYDCPSHTRYWDNLIVSKSSSDVAHLLVDPEAGGGGGGNTLALILGQAFVVTTLALQWAMILGYFWERRAAMIRAMLTIVAYMNLREQYWAWKYRAACKHWQRQAPTMLEDHSQTIILSKDEHAHYYDHR